MLIPFVGRIAELRRMTALLEADRNMVITGRFGSGRTTLVRRFASGMARDTFVFLELSHSRAAIRAALAKAASPERRAVLVLDDVVRVTPQKLAFIRELARSGACRFLVIVDSLPPDELLRLRAALGAAALVPVGPLPMSAVEAYLTAGVQEYGLGWTRHEIRATARATHGFALGMRLTLEAALRRGAGRAPLRASLRRAGGSA